MKSVMVGMKAGNSAEDMVSKIGPLKKLNKMFDGKQIPGDFQSQYEDLALGYKFEFVTKNMLSGSGLFDDVTSLENRSGHGVDIFVNQQSGEWVPLELKASRTNKYRGLDSTARVNQKMGATRFVGTTVDRAATRDKSSGWAAPLLPLSMRDTAEAIQVEQSNYNFRNNNRPDSYNGLVFQLNNGSNNDLMSMRMSDWTSTWSNSPSQTSFNEIKSFDYTPTRRAQ